MSTKTSTPQQLVDSLRTFRIDLMVEADEAICCGRGTTGSLHSIRDLCTTDTAEQILLATGSVHTVAVWAIGMQTVGDRLGTESVPPSVLILARMADEGR